jgi:hypothetical protein
MLTFIQDHLNDNLHTALLIGKADKFFVGNGFKRCSKCKEIKPRDLFSDNKSRPDGKRSQCRLCENGYYAKNKEQIDAKHREYVSDPVNRERVKQWRKKYVSCRFFYFHEPRSTRRKVTTRASARELWSLWKKQRGVCPLTGIRLNRDNSEIDHIVPWIISRDNSISNLRWVYGPVNRMKGRLLDAEFFELCRLVANQHPALLS